MSLHHRPQFVRHKVCDVEIAAKAIIRLSSLWWSPHSFLTSSFCCRVDLLQDEGTPSLKKRANFDEVRGYYGHVTKSEAFGERSKGLIYWVLISHLDLVS